MEFKNMNLIINSGTISDGVNQVAGDQVLPGAKEPSTKSAPGTTRYDLAVSYASEQGLLVSRVVKLLEEEGLAVFFAPYNEEEYAAKDMRTAFYRTYRYECRYVAAFVTDEYLQKDITMHEATTAILRSEKEKHNCLIPIYFGNARLKRLDPDVNYIRADDLLEVEIAEKIRAIVQSGG